MHVAKVVWVCALTGFAGFSATALEANGGPCSQGSECLSGCCGSLSGTCQASGVKSGDQQCYTTGVDRYCDCNPHAFDNEFMCNLSPELGYSVCEEDFCHDHEDCLSGCCLINARPGGTSGYCMMTGETFPPGTACPNEGYEACECSSGYCDMTYTTISGGGYCSDISEPAYKNVGCFVDKKTNRLMSERTKATPMSAEICYGICNDGSNTHFGTQNSNECWCGKDVNLEANGPWVDYGQCDKTCAGSVTYETCGGKWRMSAYTINSETYYLGCWADSKRRRSMNDGQMETRPGEMTLEMCVAYCRGIDEGYPYAGAEHGRECWCGYSYDRNGPADDAACSYPCEGDNTQTCGGYNALSVYKTGIPVD